ncbi:MAG: hypothetical protein EOO56_13750 [Hymenobacter sp.]|nr:MAG: hypothetical protein EOO56_13750 [Hymenobacter sp.]
MELDDLRRQWQQPEPVAPATLTTAELTQLVARQSGSIVEQLRRNARWELGLNYGLGLVALGLAIGIPQLWLRLLASTMGLVALVCIYYFHRKLGLLRSMASPAGHLRAHLVRITEGLRALTRFYYRLTLWTGPYTMLLLLGFFTGKELHRAAEPRWPLLGLVAGLALVVGAACQVGIIYLTRWYLQRLYGQHLDRLEGQLRELDGLPGPVAP